MLGAIIGDLAGSIYEYDQFYKVQTLNVKNILPNNVFLTDDTVLTIAVLDAIINKKSYNFCIREYGNKFINHIPKNVPYFETLFSEGFVKFLEGNKKGKSCGNGAMMRIAPVGFLFNTKKEVIKNAKLATTPSHNTHESVKHAKLIALIIFYIRQGLTKNQIITKLKLKIKKPNLKEFNHTCKETIDVCLYSFFTGNSFEECIKIALSFGGDTDSNACITGAMAEAMFGISETLKNKALKKLPKEFVELLNIAYSKVENIKIS